MAESLSRRERQIMDLLHRLGEASAADIEAALPDPPSYSAVRAHLRILEEKGHVQHRQEQTRYVYAPTVRTDKARKGALRHLVETFFGGSSALAAAALLDARNSKFTAEEIARLEELIQAAKKAGR